MSGNSSALALRPEDVTKFLACQAHIGSSNLDFQMEQYVFKRKKDGVYIINLRRTWEKILVAARALAAIENPADICVISCRPYGQRAILKFSAHTGATPIAGRFTPGAFTNQIQAAFREPRILIVTDPRSDHQAITEASYAGIPVIAFANTDSPLRLIDIAIPCNNKGHQSIGLMWWMLAREVLLMKGLTSREMSLGKPIFVLEGKEIMADLYFYRDPEEAEKEEQAEKQPKEAQEFHDDRWGQELPPQQQPMDWAQETANAMAMDGFHAPPATGAPLDWAQETQRATGGDQWSSPQQAGGANEWGGGGNPDWH